MALLRNFKGATIQENNIVQTVASAAGTLSSIIFVLPGLVIIGWWTGFPYWTSFLICALGGILGVMYSIPLRRALVTNSDLPYPEGVACAEVLKVGSPGAEGTAEGAEASRAGLLAVVWGAVVAAAFAIIVATRIFASDVKSYFKVGESASGNPSVSGFDFALSMALFAVGHLVGLWVGLAMLLGAAIAWIWGVPHFSSFVVDATGSPEAIAAATHGAPGALRRRRHDRSRGDLYARQADQACLRRPGVGDAGQPRAQGGQPRVAAAHRTRHPDSRGRHDHGGVLRADRLPALVSRWRDRPRRACALR
jgi:putative OPT family oligopeptide transporter